jgi:hypothetical protein
MGLLEFRISRGVSIIMTQVYNPDNEARNHIKNGSSPRYEYLKHVDGKPTAFISITTTWRVLSSRMGQSRQEVVFQLGDWERASSASPGGKKTAYY